jgi:hypothetical protein
MESSNGAVTIPLNNDDEKNNKNPCCAVPNKGSKAITPYLPPPVIDSMKRIDPLLKPLVGKEATINTAWSVESLVGMIFDPSGDQIFGIIWNRQSNTRG